MNNNGGSNAGLIIAGVGLLMLCTGGSAIALFALIGIAYMAFKRGRRP